MSEEMARRQIIRVAVNTSSWIPTKQEWLMASQCVQIEEKERIGKFVFKRDAKLSMMGRLLIRCVLADMTGRSTSSILLARTNKGKPYVKSGVDFPGAFNVAHHGDYSIISVDRNVSRIGVDIMKIKPRKNMSKFFDTMKRQFTIQEWDMIGSQVGELNKLAMFYRFWCLKESYVKAIGTGIGFEVGRLNFNIRTATLSTNDIVTNTFVEVDGCKENNWLFEEVMLDTEHCVAVATRLSSDNTSPVKTNSSIPLFTIRSPQDILVRCIPLPGSEPDLHYWDTFNKHSESPNTDVV